MTSTAEQILVRYQEGGWDYVRHVVEAPDTESLHLDFKLEVNATSGILDRDDRKDLGEALSGFANAEGGVIVWGVNARREGDYDAAISLAPLRDLRAVLDELARYTPVMVHFILVDRGRGLARYPSLTLEAPVGYSPYDGTGKYGGRLPLAEVPAPPRCLVTICRWRRCGDLSRRRVYRRRRKRLDNR